MNFLSIWFRFTVRKPMLSSVLLVTAAVLFLSFHFADAQRYTRGIGVYPGDPAEDFSPLMQIDSVHYRNIALHRPVYQSSAYDFNLTAQLVTDGIIDSKLPGWIVVSTSNGIVPRNEREWILDRNPMTRKSIEGSNAWIQVELAGGYEIPDVDSFNVAGTLLVDSLPPQPWTITIGGSNDGTRWDTLGTVGGGGLPGDTLTGFFRRFFPQNLRAFGFPLGLKKDYRYKYYRCFMNSPNAESWSIGELGMYHDGKHAAIGGPYHFTSAWKSGGNGEEWIYVDLGDICSFNRVELYWIRRALEGSVEVSNDASTWSNVAPLPGNSGDTVDVRLKEDVKARYVRILMTKPSSDDGYILSELQIYGTGGPVAVPHEKDPIQKDGVMNLSGGSWKLERQSLVNSDGESLSRPGFADTGWMIATVPATVLVSYLNDGALPDPNYGDNQFLISDSYFYSDFWYRDVFMVPADYQGKRTYLNFDGINWKAEVYLNGKNLGDIDGAFIRGKFDVTDILMPGKENVIAVRIIKNDAPGFVKEQTKYSHDANGGELGTDNPTFHASVGWDWIPTIRGRNTGIWNKVYLSESGPVTIDEPFVSAALPLPDTTSADITITAALTNHTAGKVTGLLKGKFGDAEFEREVDLEPSEMKTITLDPLTNASLRVRDPHLWWPNGYGVQNLYDVKLEFVTADGDQSDSKSFQTGIREMSYSEDGGVLRIWVNGRRFIARGGNWGFSESMLRYRKREYDIAVRYHKEMNFTMIRNWVGQTADDAFYDACDKYGIMVWQDFWLANPLDGPNPSDNKMFLDNVNDFVKRIRNHPSIGLYVGRNEGNPPAAIDSSIRKFLPEIHPGIHYISNSAFGVVSGGGPYRAMPVKFYFEQRATTKLHSEMGMPNVVSFESLKRMMPDSSLWPINTMWGIHDFNLESAQYADSFLKMITDDFGSVDSLREWLTLAQWINYQGYRAMFEAQSRNRMGVLLWMSHPAWPSMVWQTYDYYFEPTAAYFGSKEGCEPLHIQWNALTDSIEVVNYSVPNGAGLTAAMELLGLDGKVKFRKQASVSCPEDSTVRVFAVQRPAGLTDVHFIRLKLTRKSKLISENFYWEGKKESDLKAIMELPRVKLKVRTKSVKKGSSWHLTTTLVNNTKTPALMVRLKVVGSKSEMRILPVIFSDNYISLMPGEKRAVEIELEKADTRGEKPVVVAEGINLK